MTDEIHQGQKGVLFKATVKDRSGNVQDLTGATLEMDFRAPTNVIATQSSGVTLDGAATLGKIQYDDVTPLWTNTVGAWEYRARVTLSSGDILKGDWIQYIVQD